MKKMSTMEERERMEGMRKLKEERKEDMKEE